MNIDRLKKTVRRWLDVRAGMHRAAIGMHSGANASRARASLPYLPSEVELGKQLKKLLQEMDPDAALPDDPESLAAIFLGNLTGPAAQGFLPILLVGGAVLLLASFVQTWADKAKHDREVQACEAGVKEYCPTDYTKWLMFGGAAFGAWYVVTKTKLFKKA